MVEDAWFAGAPVQLRYRKKDGSRGEQVVRIESIVLERSETLLNCVDVQNAEKRQLRLHQVEKAEYSPTEPGLNPVDQSQPGR